MADIDSLQLPDGSQYNVVDKTSDYATKGYVQDQIGTINKTTIGLGNVDNTSDANKPVSTAQQNALNEKLYSDVIADEESEFTASRRYEAGEQFIYQGALYVTTAIVPNGDPFEVGTNVELSDDILTQMSDADTELNDNISAIINVYGSKNLFDIDALALANVTISESNNVVTLTNPSYGYYPRAELSLLPFKAKGISKLKLTVSANGSDPTSSIKILDGYTTIGGVVTYGQTEVAEEYDISNVSDPKLVFYVGSTGSIAINSTLVLTDLMIRDARISDDTYVPYAPTNRELMSYKANGIVGAKNLLKYPYYHTTKTVNGITWTDNGNGTVTASGIASANTDFILQYPPAFKAGTYIFSGRPDNSGVRFQIIKNSSYFVNLGYGENTTFTLDSDLDGTNDYIQLRVMSGTNLSTPITFKPMIRIAEDTDETYQPYAMTNRELTEVKSISPLSVKTSPTMVSSVNQFGMRVGNVVILNFQFSLSSLQKGTNVVDITNALPPRFTTLASAFLVASSVPKGDAKVNFDTNGNVSILLENNTVTYASGMRIDGQVVYCV